MAVSRWWSIAAVAALLGVSDPASSLASQQADNSARREDRRARDDRRGTADRRELRSQRVDTATESDPLFNLLRSRPGLPTGPGTCDSLTGTTSPSDGYRYYLRRTSLWSHVGQNGEADFDQAATRINRVIDLIDPARPGAASTAAETIALMERTLRIVEICGAEGRAALGLPILGADLVPRWRATLQNKAALFAQSYSASVDIEGGASADYRAAVARSSILRAAMQQYVPTRLATIDAVNAETPESRRLAAAETARRSQAAAAARVEAVRAAAVAALPERAGAWRKTGETTYSRSAPSGITARLGCGELGGLVLSLTLPSGAYFLSETAVRNSGSTNVSAYATMSGSQRRFDAGLQTHPGGLNLTLYDNTVANISIQSTQMQASYVSNGLGGVADAIDRTTGVARQDNPLSLMLGLLGDLAGAGIEAGRYRNLEIDQVRNLSTLPLSIDVQSMGRVSLFDLAPTSAPFRNLMDTCWP